MTTHQVAPGTVAQLNDAKPEPAPLKASLTDILSTDTPSVRMAVLNSFVSSINIALVSACRQHVRYGDIAAPAQREAHADEIEHPDDQFAGGIDHFGDTADHADEAKAINDYATTLAGNKIRMPALQVAKHLGMIRSYVLDLQAMLNSERAPRPIGESIDFLLSKLPTEVDPNAPHIKVLAEVAGITPEVAALMAGEANRQERQQLMTDANEIIDLAVSLTDCNAFSDELCEQAFDALPPVNQINLFTAACNALVSAYAGAFKKVLRGKIVAAGDMPIAKAMYVRGVTELKALKVKWTTDVADFEDNGGNLKELKQL